MSQHLLSKGSRAALAIRLSKHSGQTSEQDLGRVKRLESSEQIFAVN